MQHGYRNGQRYGCWSPINQESLNLLWNTVTLSEQKEQELCNIILVCQISKERICTPPLMKPAFTPWPVNHKQWVSHPRDALDCWVIRDYWFLPTDQGINVIDQEYLRCNVTSMCSYDKPSVLRSEQESWRFVLELSYKCPKVYQLCQDRAWVITH